MNSPSSLDELIQALRCLPGVGPKSAQRAAYHLVQRDHPGATRLAAAITRALTLIQHCEKLLRDGPAGQHDFPRYGALLHTKSALSA